PRIWGRRIDGTTFMVYPMGRKVPFVNIFRQGFVLDGPIGGMCAREGKIFVTHRDASGRGVITAFGYDGSHTTIVSDLPAQGDFGVTDIAVHPSNGRLFFGVGTATNSGVVGLDNIWVKKHPDVCD